MIDRGHAGHYVNVTCPGFCVFMIAFAGPPDPVPAPELTPAPESTTTVQVGQQIAPPPAPAPDPALKRGLGLTIAGFSMFFATYALPTAFSTELEPEVGRPLLIPLAGPFISAARSDSPGGSVVAALFGVFQATGLSMGIAGAVIYGKARRRARVSADLGGLQVQF